MARRVSPAGWVIVAGSTWLTQADTTPSVFSVNEAKRYDRLPDWKIRHGGWVLDFHFSPNGRLRENTPGAPWMERHPDACHLYPPGFGYEQDSTHVKLPMRAVWTRFDGAEKIGLRNLTDNATGFARILDPNHVVVDKLRNMARIAEERGDDAYLPVFAEFITIADILLHATPAGEGIFEVSDKKNVRTDPIVDAVKSVLVSHIETNISLTEIAARVHASVATLERHYTARMGESIMQTLMRMRLMKARQLLLQGSGVKDVADKTGFWDASHFSRMFKQHLGKSPRAYVEALVQRRKPGRTQRV